MRARDALGRPVASDDPAGVEAVSEQALPAQQALDAAQALLDAGRAFSAHEVLEAAWKAAPDGQRELWQGLAQVCVGVTHLQRGNPVGAVRLLQRGAGRLPDGPLGEQVLAFADRIAAGDLTPAALRLRDYVPAPPGPG